MSRDHTDISSSAETSQTSRMKEKAEPVGGTVCPRCQGVGYYLLEVPVGDPSFGQLITCEACKKVHDEQRVFHERLVSSNMSAFQDKTFETFASNLPGVQEAYTRSWRYARQHPFKGWLVLFGTYGCGKTHLAAAIGNVALKRNYRVIFAVVPDLLDYLRSTFGPTSNVAYDERFDVIREIPLLILDDLGTENTTPWAREKLFQIINHRYNYRLPTIITINRKLEEIEPRILSRLSDQSLHEGIVSITAGDYRPRNKSLVYQ